MRADGAAVEQVTQPEVKGPAASVQGGARVWRLRGRRGAEAAKLPGNREVEAHGEGAQVDDQAAQPPLVLLADLGDGFAGVELAGLTLLSERGMLVPDGQSGYLRLSPALVGIVTPDADDGTLRPQSQLPLAAGIR